MATTIGTLAIKVSASLESLKADFAQMEKMSAQSGQKIGKAAGAALSRGRASGLAAGVGAAGEESKIDEPRDWMRLMSLVAGKGTAGLMLKAAAGLGALGAAALGVGELVRIVVSSEKTQDAMKSAHDAWAKVAQDAATAVEPITVTIMGGLEVVGTGLHRFGQALVNTSHFLEDRFGEMAGGELLSQREAVRERFAGNREAAEREALQREIGLQNLELNTRQDWLARLASMNIQVQQIQNQGPGPQPGIVNAANQIFTALARGAEVRQAGLDVAEWSRQISRSTREVEFGADAARILELRLHGANEAQIQMIEIELRRRQVAQQVAQQAAELNQIREGIRERALTPFQAFERQMEDLQRSGLEGSRIGTRETTRIVAQLEQALGVGVQERLGPALTRGTAAEASFVNQWRRQQQADRSPEERARRIQERILEENQRQTREGQNSTETLRRIRDILDRLRVADRR